MNDSFKEMAPAIQKVLFGYLSDLAEIKGLKIKKAVWLEVGNVLGCPENKIAFSGKSFEIRPEGRLRILEDLENGSRSVTLKFWSLGMKIRYNNSIPDFEVENIGHFQAFNL